MQSLIKPGEGQAPCCKICIYSRPMAGLEELSCEKKGVVRQDYYCRKFSLDILSKSARRRHSLNKDEISKKDFSL